MKIIFIVLIILFFICCENNSTNPEDEYKYTWPIFSDSMNLTILIVDYQTYDLEGGNLLHYNLCIDSDSSSLPFLIEFDSPGDSGGIVFKYSQTNDTLFAASIWWMGLGEIIYPRYFLSPDSFRNINKSIQKPETSEYFDYWLFLSQATLEAKTDSVWKSIKFLDIVNDYGIKMFRVGFYLYTPSVGLFNPDPAKWIVFLYQ